MALRPYVCPESTTTTGSRNMVRVMGHMSSSGSASRSASRSASGRSPRALVERRVRTPELAFPDAGCDTADVLRRFEGAIERTPGIAASPALGTLRNFGSPVSFRRPEDGRAHRFRTISLPGYQITHNQRASLGRWLDGCVSRSGRSESPSRRPPTTSVSCSRTRSTGECIEYP